MTDQNNAPELPARIWAWSEDDDFLRAKPHGVLHGTEYVRADRAAPEGQVLTDALGNIAAMGYSDDPAVSQRIARYAVEMARQAREEYFALTPPPAAPTDNTALVEAERLKEHYRNCWKAQLERANGLEAALASREPPPASQQEAEAEITSAKEILSAIGAYAGSRIDIAIGHIDAALRALEGRK